ncbi:DDB1- and CUL4-associated factor 17, partial [Blomia tropicalis]
MDGSFSNILHIIQKREHGFYHYPHRSCAKLFRSLLRQSNTMFESKYIEGSTKPIYIVEDNVYFKNFQMCKNFGGSVKTPITKWISIVPYVKIFDFHTIHAVNLPFAPVPNEEYRNTFIILGQNSSRTQLYIVDIEDGDLLREIFIGYNRCCKFRHLSFQKELDLIYVISTRQHCKDTEPNILFSVIVFKVLPLTFLGSIDFTADIFKKNLKEIDFHNDILVALYGSNTENCHAILYDFNQILSKENKLFDAKLDSYCENVNGVIGELPIGIPINFKISNLPPKLMDVKCCSDSIEFSILPKVYILSTPKKSGQFEVYDVFTHRLIGTVGNARNNIEKYYDLKDDLIFIDIRDRIVYQTNNKIQLFSIVEDEDDGQRLPLSQMRTIGKKLKLNFDLKLTNDEHVEDLSNDQIQNSDKQENGERRILPMRRSKMKSLERLRAVNKQDIKINAIHYNNVLEIFVVLAIIPTEAGSGNVLLFDAVTGDLLLKFYTSFSVKEENEYDVYMFYDKIFIVEKIIKVMQYYLYGFQMNRDDHYI